MNNNTARINMVKQQLRTNNIQDESVLHLYDILPRHEFVPAPYAAFAYSDTQIALGHEQRMLTPLEECLMLQALQLTGTETVLEVGTGSGFFTALLSKLSKHVISIDYFSEFTEKASLKLKAHQCTNVDLITGDASRGWLDKAPFDVVVFTGAIEEVTQTHELLIVPGGKLVTIQGKAPLMHAMLHSLDHKGSWQHQLLFETEIPALIDPLKAEEFVF